MVSMALASVLSEVTARRMFHLFFFTTFIEVAHDKLGTHFKCTIGFVLTRVYTHETNTTRKVMKVPSFPQAF